MHGADDALPWYKETTWLNAFHYPAKQHDPVNGEGNIATNHI